MKTTTHWKNRTQGDVSHFLTKDNFRGVNPLTDEAAMVVV